MPKTFFITTAIDYTNSPPHVGHAYEKVLADVIARYHRLKREKVFFLTGVDQHGQKVQQSAAKAGVAPAEFVKDITQKFIDLWTKLEISHNAWASTTHKLHRKVVQNILTYLYYRDDVYSAPYRGWYSVRQEQFLTDKERGADGEFGPEWGEVVELEEDSYYFRLTKYKPWLIDFIKKKPDLIAPSFRQRELANAAEKIEEDLSISRPKSRLAWGIPFPSPPFSEGFVTYVWVDALANYISFAGYNPEGMAGVADPDFELPNFHLLAPALQVIGKDILVPAHGIYWLCILKALGFEDSQMPRFVVHGWWNISGAKISKSTGKIVDPKALVERYGAEALRYYLMSDIATGKDADFSEERLIERYNADLANTLGNLLNRTLNMAHRYRDGFLKPSEPASSSPPPRSEIDFGKALAVYRMSFEGISVDAQGHSEIRSLASEFGPDYSIQQALNVAIGVAAVHCNQLIDAEKPWVLAKNDQNERLDSVLYTLAEALRLIAILISPVLPTTAHNIFDQLNWKMELSGKEERFSLADAEWGRLPDGHVVGKPMPLFPRIELDKSILRNELEE
jgi:methionyl-tRNA synthetase